MPFPKRACRTAALLAFTVCLAAPVSRLPGAEALDPTIRVPVVDRGAPALRVLIAEDHPEIAASVGDLVEYAARITGARLSVELGLEDLPGPTLHVGRTGMAEGFHDALRGVRGDGFVLARTGEDLLVTGAIPQGTANGVQTIAHFRQTPAIQDPGSAERLVRAAAARRGSRTIYEATLDWRLLPGFVPAPRRSLGIALPVSDRDVDRRRTAEHGAGVLPRRRPTEFAALRLAPPLPDGAPRGEDD